MGSLDVDSLSINIPLEETIDICANTFFEKLKECKFYQKYNLRKLYLLLQKNLILDLMESSTNKTMESLWVYLAMSGID